MKWSFGKKKSKNKIVEPILIVDYGGFPVIKIIPENMVVFVWHHIMFDDKKHKFSKQDDGSILMMVDDD